jgi:hypothetical protein
LSAFFSLTAARLQRADAKKNFRAQRSLKRFFSEARPEPPKMMRWLPRHFAPCATHGSRSAETNRTPSARQRRSKTRFVYVLHSMAVPDAGSVLSRNTSASGIATDPRLTSHPRYRSRVQKKPKKGVSEKPPFLTPFLRPLAAILGPLRLRDLTQLPRLK